MSAGGQQRQVPRQVPDHMITTPYIPIFLPRWDKGISRAPEPGQQLGEMFPSAAVTWAAQLCHRSCSLSDDRMTGCLLTQVGARRGRSCEVCSCCGFSAQSGESQGSPKRPEWANSFRAGWKQQHFRSGICCCLMNPVGIRNHFIPLPKTGLGEQRWMGGEFR